jgi:hypothetical protein
MSKTLYYWEVYCVDDAKYEYTWDHSIPTTCPSNASHTILTHPGPRILDEVSDGIVKLKEEETPTKGYYKFNGFLENIPESNPKGNITVIDLSWKYPISILNGWFYASNEQVGDKIDVTIGENTIIGSLTSNANVGDITVNVSDSVLENAEVGWKLNLFDGVVSEDLGEAIDIDTGNNQVTFENSLTNNFNYTNPVYVRLVPNIVNDLYINVGNIKYSFADKKIGGKYVPKNTSVKIKYKNNEGNSKQFAFNIEYLF